MKRFGTHAAVAVFSILLLAGSAIAASPQTIRLPSADVLTKKSGAAGLYQGRLDLPNHISLTLVFHVRDSRDGPTATIDVIEQNAAGIPVTKMTVAGDAVTFVIDTLHASFSGKLSGDKKTITGTFTQAGHDFPFVLTQTDKVTGPDRPQTPKSPFPYRTEDVSYPNPSTPGVTLAGTLDIPSGKGTFPVVLFITSIGPQDRDNAVAGHRPFLVIADYLARRGIASLRVDDRGIGKSTGDFTTATTADFATDARAGVAYLKTRTDVIDPTRIGLIGHSEGGIIASMVASTDPEVSFIVLLAATGVRGDLVMLAQEATAAQMMGMDAKDLSLYHHVMAKMYDVVVQETDPSAVPDKLKSQEEDLLSSAPESMRTGMRAQLDQAVRQLSNPWLQYMVRYDPQPALKAVHCPVLALDGARDVQVIPAQNLPAIQGALTAGGNKDFSVQALPGLNYLFQHARTGAPTEYATNSETFAPEVLTIIGDWIKSHTSKKR